VAVELFDNLTSILTFGEGDSSGTVSALYSQNWIRGIIP